MCSCILDFILPLLYCCKVKLPQYCSCMKLVLCRKCWKFRHYFCWICQQFEKIKTFTKTKVQILLCISLATHAVPCDDFRAGLSCHPVCFDIAIDNSLLDYCFTYLWVNGNSPSKIDKVLLCLELIVALPWMDMIRTCHQSSAVVWKCLFRNVTY